MAEQVPKQGDAVEAPETSELTTVAAPLPPNRPRKVYGGMWGPLEIVAVSLGALAILTASLLYFFLVIPSDRELAKNKSEADRLDAELIAAKSKYGEITSTEAQVGKLLSSVDDFQTRFLPVSSNGQTALYQRLNGLIRAYGLVNTTGPDYAPLETAELNPGQQTDEERGRAKFRSLFPGVYVTVTIEGSYQNLRRFIREIETGREFIIVSSVELAPSDTEKQKNQTSPNANPVAANPIAGGVNPNGFPAGINPTFAQQAPVQQAQTKQKGKMHGETVSLHLEMAAYFRRPGFVPMTSESTEQ